MPGHNMNVQGFKGINKYNFGWVPICLLFGRSCDIVWKYKEKDTTPTRLNFEIDIASSVSITQRTTNQNFYPTSELSVVPKYEGYSERNIWWATRKRVLYTKNTYILKLLLKVVSAGTGALVVSGNKFCVWLCQRSLLPVRSTTFQHLPSTPH
jgi:hypothetical protein